MSPSPPSSKRHSGHGITTIDKLDYPPNSPRRPLLSPDVDSESQRRSQGTSYAGSFFEQVAEGIYELRRGIFPDGFAESLGHTGTDVQQLIGDVVQADEQKRLSCDQVKGEIGRLVRLLKD